MLPAAQRGERAEESIPRRRRRHARTPVCGTLPIATSRPRQSAAALGGETEQRGERNREVRRRRRHGGGRRAGPGAGEGEGGETAAVGGAGGGGVGAGGGGERLRVPALLARRQGGARVRPEGAHHARRRQRRRRERGAPPGGARQLPPAVAHPRHRLRLRLLRLRHALARRHQDRRHAVLGGTLPPSPSPVWLCASFRMLFWAICHCFP